MNYRTLGRSGLKVSEICLGSWINFGDRIADDEAFAVLDAAVDAGINFFDTADVYASGKAEQVIGRWMKEKDRRTIVLATKGRGPMWAGPNGASGSRKHLMAACDDSLRRLQTDYIDLYQLHWPDDETPLEETVRAMDDLVNSGKVLYYGWSNFDAPRITEASSIVEKYGLHKPISLQNCYNLLLRDIEKDILPLCEKEGIGQIPYSPLAQGLLSDKYLAGSVPDGTRGSGNTDFQRRLTEVLPTLTALVAFARDHHATMAQLALAWLLTKPTMASPIIGATRPEQVVENVKAIDIKLSGEDLKEIDRILKG